MLHAFTSRTRALATAAGLAALLAVLFPACAKQGYPSGGPKDTAPPAIAQTRPPNETRHFDRQSFYIGFDEYAVMKDADNNVIVSPPLKYKPEYIPKGKGMLVKLRDTLQPDATYLFQFKGAIADFTEGNVLPTFEYVFSTGADMDTLMLGGSVVNARDGKPWKGTVTVMAYLDSTGLPDTVGAAAQPDYITRCNADGSFAFHYIRPGNYRLVAVEDKNRNLRIGRDEAAAWVADAVAATDSIDSTRLATMRISSPDLRQQRLLKSEFTARGRATIVTYLPMQHPSLEGDSLEWRLNSRRDTMSVWFRNEQCDSALLVLTDTALADTLRMRYRAPRRKRRRGEAAATEGHESLVRPLCEGDKAFYDDLRLRFSTPILPPSDTLTAEIMLLKDSSVSRCTFSIDSLRLEARLATVLRSGEKYRLRLRPGAFTSIFGHPSDSLELTLTPRDYGTIRLHVDHPAGGALVIELLDSKDSVKASKAVVPPSEIAFLHLEAGEYRLRAVIDADGNGKWTPGNYFLSRQPEEAVLYHKTLQVREKWEIEERWTLGKKRRSKPDDTDTP